MNLAEQQQFATQEGIVGYVEEEFKRRLQEKRPFELQWRLNIAFLEGNQYVDINPVAMTLEEIPKLFWWEEREVFNHIAPNIETRISRLNRLRPVLQTRPGTGSQEDIRAAKVGTQLLRTIYEEQGIRNLMSEAYAWMESCGTVLFKHTWNPGKGPLIANMETKSGIEEIYEGDLDVILVPPQEFFPDSCYRQDVGHCRSVIHAKAYHVDEVEEIWGVKVDPEDTSVMKLQRSKTGIGGLGYGLGGFQFTTVKLKNHVLVKEYSEVPSKRFPEGRLIIVAGGKLLYYGPLPYFIGPNGKRALHFSKVVCIERPGMFWGKTVVERMIPLQRRYNALRNRKAEYLNRAAIGVMAVEEGSTDIDLLESDGIAPGSIIPYNRGYNAPTFLSNPQLPQAFETELANLLQEFSILSGVSEISRQSHAPPGVKSGVALAIALEQDETRLSSVASNVEQFLTECGRIWLRMYKQFVSGTRVLRIIGKNNVVEVIDWTAADIRSDDVVVEGISATVESPAHRRQMVFDLLASGLFIDPDTGRISKEMRNKILEKIELGNWETGEEEDRLHISKAERENLQLSQGIFLQAVDYDDHVLHISRHNRYRLTMDYEQLMTENPNIELMFRQHVDMHLNFLAQQVQQMQQVQAPPSSPKQVELEVSEPREGGEQIDALAARQEMGPV